MGPTCGPPSDSKVHGANMWAPGGPHVGPMNLAIWDVITTLVHMYKSWNVDDFLMTVIPGKPSISRFSLPSLAPLLAYRHYTRDGRWWFWFLMMYFITRNYILHSSIIHFYNLVHIICSGKITQMYFFTTKGHLAWVPPHLVLSCFVLPSLVLSGILKIEVILFQ